MTWTGLQVAVALIGVSILDSGPIMLPQRQPGAIDWLEDKLSTGLLGVAVALPLDDLPGKTLTPQDDRVAFRPSPLRPRRASPWSAVPEVAAEGSARMLRKGKWAATYA